MFIARTILASLVLVECLASARYVGHGSHDYSFENDWREVSAHLQSRQSNSGGGLTCRTPCGGCGSSCSGGAVSKRDLLNIVTSNDTFLGEYDAENENHHLSKRKLKDVRQAAIGSYLGPKLNVLVKPSVNPNSNLINLVFSAPQSDYTFATLKKFSDYDSNVLNIGAVGLHGCTVVTVVSPTAVYMGHFFENLAFLKDDLITPTSDITFQQNCLNLITGQGQKWRTRGDSLDPSQFTGSNGPAIAFIMTPRPEQANPTAAVPNPPVAGPNSQEYPGRMAQISQTLTTLIPGLTIVYYNYIRLEEIEITALYQGVALFEYDPNADGFGNANFRIWYEQTMRDGQSLELFP